MAVVSFLDDVRELPARLRFGIQCIAASAFLYVVDQRTVNSPDVLGMHPSGLAAALFFALWLIGYTNAFNFMDGINGIAAGQAVVTAIGSALIGSHVLGSWTHPLVLASLITAGAALGFLPHNFPKARMFMGDVGSAPLGFILAALAVAIPLEASLGLIAPLFLLHANYILDTGITLVRRILRGEKFYQAHREHFYQRLVRSGKSHTFVTACEVLLQLITLALALAYLNANLPLRILLVSAVLLLWLAFYAWIEIRFRAQCPEVKAPSGLGVC